MLPPLPFRQDQTIIVNPALQRHTRHERRAPPSLACVYLVNMKIPLDSSLAIGASAVDLRGINSCPHARACSATDILPGETHSRNSGAFVQLHELIIRNRAVYVLTRSPHPSHPAPGFPLRFNSSVRRPCARSTKPPGAPEARSADPPAPPCASATTAAGTTTPSPPSQIAPRPRGWCCPRSLRRPGRRAPEALLLLPMLRRAGQQQLMPSVPSCPSRSPGSWRRRRWSDREGERRRLGAAGTGDGE